MYEQKAKILFSPPRRQRKGFPKLPYQTGGEK